MWLLIQAFPGFFIRIFTTEAEVLETGVPLMRLFYAAFFIMALQFAGQSTFLSLGFSKQAIFFSTLRKVILVAPLVVILPRLWGLGVSGVFLSEPISEVIGGIACYVTMLLTVWKELTNGELAPEATPQTTP
ncbi:MAG: MATE family efflux transporter, partial [Clostridia bacterium]|nr:MATE family efflux transporter [Clostridia bacterium]